jgi:two-component system secretion response regulator SsrB
VVDLDTALPDRRQTESERAISIVVIGSGRLFSDALTAVLNAQPDMKVVASLDLAPGWEAVTVDELPKVAVIDFSVDPESASAAASRLRRSVHDIALVVLGRPTHVSEVHAAIEAEASAIVSVTSTAEEFVTTVRAAASGINLIRPRTVASMLGAWRVREFSSYRLTRRERDVLRLLAQGAGNREMAITLGIGYLTVRTHVRNLATKLMAHSKLEIVARAYQLELLPAPHATDVQPPGGTSNPHLTTSRKML